MKILLVEGWEFAINFKNKGNVSIYSNQMLVSAAILNCREAIMGYIFFFKLFYEEEMLMGII